MNTELLLVTDLVGSVIVIVGAVWGGFRWGRKIARSVSAWVDSVGGNTAATQELTGTVTEVRDDIREVVSTLKVHGERLDDLDGRVTQIEKNH